MPRQRKDEEPEECYADLDEMVLAEIESLDRHRRGPPRNECVPRQATVHPIAKRTSEPEPTQFFGEEAEILQQALEETPEEEDAIPKDDIFTPEEHTFMTRAVGFLRGRANADAILGRIWEEVTEGDPQAFFSPEDASTPADEEKGEGPVADAE